MSSSSKFAADKNQRILLELVNQPGNDVCADCKARNPRWASHNLGIFICVNCASIHRKIGTHITKVKSVTLDTWTKEQVENMKKIGNVASNAKYNPDEKRYPPPTNYIETERDSELEKYIRAKYEFKSFRKRNTAYEALPDGLPGVSSMTPSSSVDRSAAVAALLGPSRSAASRVSSTSSNRASTFISSPSTSTPPSSAKPAAPQPPFAQQPVQPPAVQDLSRQPMRSVSLSNAPPMEQQAQPQQTAAPASGVWGDLQSLQTKTIDATLPLQVVAAPTGVQPMAVPPTQPSYLNAPNPFANLSASPGNPFPTSYNQNTGTSPSSFGRSMSLGTGMSAGLGQNYTGASLSPFPSSPFQPSPMSAGVAPINSGSSAPSPNPFAQQAMQQAQTGAYGQSGMMGLPSQSPSPFNATSFVGQQPTGQPQMYQTQSQFQPQMQQQMQYAQPQANPYMQNSSPFMGAQMGSTPSPFQPMQPQQQPQQQQQQGFGATNPFTSWVQQPPQQQGGYQQQWGM